MSVIAVPFHVPLVIVPTCVREDPVTPLPRADELNTEVPPILYTLADARSRLTEDNQPALVL